LGAKISIFNTAFRPDLETIEPPTQGVPRASSPDVQRPRHEADHLLPFDVAVKNAWRVTSTPPYIFIVLCILKHKETFIVNYFKAKTTDWEAD
jgi:hypothetical protein